MLARFRPSPALLVASVALIVALGGTGYAASQHADRAQDVALIKQLARPKAYSGKLASKALPNGAPSGDTLVVKLPRGNYLTYAKLNIGRTSASGTGNGLCNLFAFTGSTAASNFDFTAVDNVGSDGAEDRAALSLQLRATIGPGGGSVRLQCYGFPIGIDPVQLTASDVRLAAVAIQP